jgi:hypothetical protein
MVSWFVLSMLQMWKGVLMENKPFEAFEIGMWQETSLSMSILPICHQSQNYFAGAYSQEA